MFLQVISFVGALLILGAYVSYQRGWMGRENRWYSAMNLVGGALLASVGTEEAPLELTMETVELTVSEPVYKSWVFWTAVGVGTVAAVVTPVVFTRSAPVRPGTLGTEPLK